MDHKTDLRFGWLFLACPTFLKTLMKWSGTNHPQNPLWGALGFLETGAGILFLIALGFWWGHSSTKNRHQTLDEKMEQILKTKLEEAIRRNLIQHHEFFRKSNEQQRSLEEKISELSLEREETKRKFEWLRYKYKELKSLTPRSAEEANKEALQAVTG